MGQAWPWGPGTHGEGATSGWESQVPYLLALGRWRVEAVVRQIPGEDTQLTGDDPPRLAQLLALRGKEGPEVAGSEHCAG